LYFLNPQHRSYDAVGFERNIRQSTFALALLIGTGSAHAAPSEPFTETELPDPTFTPLPDESERSAEQLLDPLVERFSQAIAEAVRSDQQAIEQACRSRAAVGAGALNSFDWQARCTYRRH
jgi:hypothetical protein